MKTVLILSLLISFPAFAIDEDLSQKSLAQLKHELRKEMTLEAKAKEHAVLHEGKPFFERPIVGNSIDGYRIGDPHITEIDSKDVFTQRAEKHSLRIEKLKAQIDLIEVKSPTVIKPTTRAFKLTGKYRGLKGAGIVGVALGAGLALHSVIEKTQEVPSVGHPAIKTRAAAR